MFLLKKNNQVYEVKLKKYFNEKLYAETTPHCFSKLQYFYDFLKIFFF